MPTRDKQASGRKRPSGKQRPHTDRKPTRPYQTTHENTTGNSDSDQATDRHTSKTVHATSSGEAVRRVDRRIDHQVNRLESQRSVPTSARTDIDTAVRLISETAHDLRSPLASVAATLEIISEGELGHVSDVQADCLKAALRQCEYLNSLVGEMHLADGLLNGMTTLRRQAVSRSSVQQMVTDATVAVLASRHIELHFDGCDSHSSKIYADPALLCRLLVNLVVNAQRASTEGSHVLIRIKDDLDAGVARWSVSDCGRGISSEKLEQLGKGHLCEGADGSGLGLMICRQLATMQFSDLTIQSREGSGTDVTFETPLAQPIAIATAYSHFRSRLVGSQSSAFDADPVRDPERAEAASWSSASLGYAGAGLNRATRVAIGTLSVGGELTAELSDDIDSSIQSRIGRFELSYRSTRRSWVWVLDADHRVLDERIAQIGEAIGTQIDPARLQWSEYSVIPVNQRLLQRSLTDRITKQSLSAATQPAGSGIDCDEVRLGTQPITTTPIAASRLDDELQRLARRLKSQSRGLQSQTAKLRPRRVITMT